MADIIDELLALDDAAMLKKLGYGEKVATFKADLEAAKALKPEGRKKIADSLKQKFTPRPYVEDISWEIKSAKRQEKCPDLTGEMKSMSSGMCGCDLD